MSFRFAEGSLVYLSENDSVGALDVDFSRIDDDRDRLVCLLAYNGMNANSISSLKASELDSLPLNESKIKEISHFSVKGSGYLFSRHGKNLTERRIQQIVKQRLGMSISELRKKRTRKKRSCLTLEDISTIEDSIKEKKYLLMLRLILETGMTLGQTLDLRYDDVKGTRLNIPHNDSRFSERRQSCISLETFSMLISSRADMRQQYIFTNKKGDRMSSRRVQQVFSGYSKLIGKRVTPREIRNVSMMCNASSEEPDSPGDYRPITSSGRYEVT